MGVTVCLPLFGEPGREIGEGTAVNGKQLRDLGTALQERLDKAAAAVDSLAAGGWSARVALFDVLLHHPQVETRDEAERLLRTQGIDPERLIIVEDVEDEEDEV